MNIKTIALFFVTALMLLYTGGSAVAQTYDPADTVTVYNMRGTYYHDRFEGRKTASGEIFSQKRLTAAHCKIKFGTLALVTNTKTGQQVIVKVNDRCPRPGVFDLSRRAARAIGISGSQPVQVRLLGPERLPVWQAQDAAAPAADPVAQPKPQNQPPVVKHTKTSNSGCYDLFLATVTSRAEAAELLRNLPERYQNQVEHVAEFNPDGVSLILRLGKSRGAVAELRQTLQSKFPEAALRECTKR